MTRSPRSSPERAAVALLLAGALIAGALPGVAQPAVGDLLEDPRYQREMPRHDPVQERDASRETRTPGGGGGALVPVAAGAAAQIGQTVFLVLLGVGLLLLLGAFGSRIVRRREPQAAAAAAPEKKEGDTARETFLTSDDAGRLAAEGRYGEAVHALLLAAIRHGAERSRMTIAPSRTSREVARLLPLRPEERESFSSLVREVERSLFGGAPVGPEEYERSLARFRELTRRAA